MKIVYVWLLRVVLVVVCSTWMLAAQQKGVTADVLLGQALHQEQNEGRLEDAIATYKKVLAAADATREQKARAQFRIGTCYERLGTSEARKAYQAVVANYGDQADLAAQAKARLAALGKEPTLAGRTAAARLIWAKQNGTLPLPTPDGPGLASLDGKSLVYTGGEAFDLYVYDTASGASRRLTTSKGCILPTQPCDMSLYSTAWSPDGTRIAYVWMSGDKEELRVINADGSGQRVLRDGIAHVADWSPDGQDVLASTSVQGAGNRGRDLVAVRVSDGSTRTVTPWNSGLSLNARFSPDGRFIAYQQNKPTDVVDSDLYIMLADGSGGTAVLDDSSTADLVGWTPDGSALVYLSDRGSSLGLWTVPAANGKSAGVPRLVKGDLGRTTTWDASITRDGSVYYSVNGSTSDVYVVTLDPTSATLVAPPSNVAAVYVGANSAPAWSSDGKTLAVLSGSGMRPFETEVLHTLNIETGERRRTTLSEAAGLFRPAAITGSGNAMALVTSVRGKDGVSALGWIDIRTGEVIRRIPRFVLSAFSNDGAHAYSVTRDPTARTAALSVMDLETQGVQEIYRGAAMYAYSRIAASPDGQSIAYEERTGPKRQAAILKVLQVASGEAKEVHRTQEPITVAALAWSADGKRIIFSTQDWSGDRGDQLWSIPAGGGQAVRYDTNIGLITQIAVHPDGRGLALGARRNEPDQMWVLERFLPPAKPPAKKPAPKEPQPAKR